MATEILLVLVLIVANGVFSGSEIAIVSARKVRLEQAARQGDKQAIAALKLANSPNDFLSAVQIGITLIGILSGAVGGATLATRLEQGLNQIPALAPYSNVISVVLVVSAITYLSLVIGELVPKRIALSNPEQIARTVAKPMNGLARLTSPLVYLLSLSTNAILKLLGIHASEEQPMTEDEIKVLIEQGARAGVFEVAEQEMVSRVFRLGDRLIRSLMTPRIEIVWVDIESPLEAIKQEMSDSPYSRFPVGQETLDHCLGIVSAKTLWTASRTGEPFSLESILEPALFIPENTPALNVLEQFRQSHSHIALITDEYGGVEGLVTLQDLLEAIVGNLPQPGDTSDPSAVRRDDGSWLLDGLLNLDDLRELLKPTPLPSGDEEQYHTLGGLVVNALGRIPQAGDHFERGNLRFEVMDMDGNRVDKVLVSQVSGPELTPGQDGLEA